MSKRIFLDVGANNGQTLRAALEPEFRFDQIVCFEPVEICRERLAKLADDRVKIEPFGLWNNTCEQTLYNPDTKGGSLWRKDNAQHVDTIELCKFVSASEWFAENLRYSDTVFLKLNCEGAECDILDDLLDSKEFRKVSFALIAFHGHKIAAMQYHEAKTRARMAWYPFERCCGPLFFPRVVLAEQLIGDTHQEKIKNWIRKVEAAVFL